MYKPRAQRRISQKYVVRPRFVLLLSGIDEETGEILSGYEMRKFDDDIEEPENIDDITDSDIPDEQTDNTLAEEKAFAKAFDPEIVCRLSELLGDCFILA